MPCLCVFFGCNSEHEIEYVDLEVPEIPPTLRDSNTCLPAAITRNTRIGVSYTNSNRHISLPAHHITHDN